MSNTFDKELLDYYHNYCEMTIWFKKIILRANEEHSITIRDITKEFIAEGNRILSYVPKDHKRELRTGMNKIAESYYHKVSCWSRKQKITVDMV